MTESEIKSALTKTRGDVQAAAELLASVKRFASQRGKQNTGKKEKNPVSQTDPLEPPMKRARPEKSFKILAILMDEKSIDGIQSKAEALTNLTIEKSTLEKLNRNYQLVPGTLPVEIVYFKNLEIFTCAENDLKELPAVIGKLKKLKLLNCLGNQLTSLPKEIGQLSQLEQLWCFKNQLTSLPTEIGQLSQLKDLSCSRNQLKSLPAEIGMLSQLKEVGCNRNQLTSLPPEIGNWSNLVVFDCYDNQLTSLPVEIGNWSNLEIFDCSNNKMTSLPVEVGNWSNLEEFDCSNNELTSLPMEISNLSNLVYLNYRGNNLTSLPVEFANLSNLKILTDLDLEFQEPSVTLQKQEDFEAQTQSKFMEETKALAKGKETMLDFMEGVKLKPFVLSLEGSDMFLIHFDKQALEQLSDYVAIFLEFTKLHVSSRLGFVTNIRGYLNDQKDPHLLALVSVNDNTPLLNGFLLGTFLEEDFGEDVKAALEGRKNAAEISYVSAQTPPDEVSGDYFSQNGSYYFGTMLVKIFESMARKAGKETLILYSVVNALKFYKKLGFTDAGYVNLNKRVDILTKEVSAPLDAPLWHRVLEARRSGMMADAILLSRGNLVAAAQLVWHRIC